MSDLTSGFVFNGATIYEDKCSQAYRVADLIPYFNSDEIIYCLEQSYKWPLKSVQESDTLTDILKSIDKTCYNNIRQTTKTFKWNNFNSYGLSYKFKFVKVKRAHLILALFYRTLLQFYKFCKIAW